LREQLKAIFASATQLAGNARTNETARLEAIQLLGLTSFAESGNRLLSLLTQDEPQSIQLASISALGHFAEPAVGAELTERWNTLTPRLRSEALRVLLARPERATALLNAIAAGTIRDSVLDSAQTKFLRNHNDKTVRQLATRVLDAKPATTRQQVIDSFMPALNLKGDAAHGKKIYEERCLSCHRLGGQGSALGPDLVTVKTTGKEKILVNVVDPNREVRPEFVSYVVDTKDDESYIGLIANETGASVTVRQAYGKEDVVPRTRISKMRSQGQSLMPEGLEAGLTPQDLADLIEYIETAEAK
jgi:putative heme-binding domain-containing protein